MGIFKKDQKGMRCADQPDGSITCERTMRDPKTGEILSTGESVNISADPSSGCKPRISNPNVMDGSWGNFDEIGERVSSGCQKNQAPQGSE